MPKRSRSAASICAVEIGCCSSVSCRSCRMRSRRTRLSFSMGKASLINHSALFVFVRRDRACPVRLSDICRRKREGQAPPLRVLWSCTVKCAKGTSAGLCTCGVPFSIFCFDYISGVVILQQEVAREVSLICGSSIFLFIIFII